MSDEPRQILECLRQLGTINQQLAGVVRELNRAIETIKTITDVQSWIASRFDKSIDQLESQAAIYDIIRELNDYLTSNIDRLDQMLLLILQKMPAEDQSPRLKKETDYLLQETLKSRIRSLRLQMKQHQDNLNWSEEQAAQYGPSVSLEITNKIIWEREKINEIRTELDYIEEEISKT